MPKVTWVMSCGFVANFIRFPAVQKNLESVKIQQVAESLKVGTFFETQCVSNLPACCILAATFYINTCLLLALSTQAL